MHIKVPTHVSQSEGRAALDCPLSWYAMYRLGLRSAAPESPAQRVGSIGHALAASYALHGDSSRFEEAVVAEAREREYVSPDVDDERVLDALGGDVALAEDAVSLLVREHGLGSRHIVMMPDGLFIERRIAIPWGNLASYGLFHFGKSMWPTRHGIDGQPDIVYADLDAIYVDDYKFRSRPDLSGTDADRDCVLPDLQGAWYRVLLHAVGIGRGRPVVFRQVNVYAGRWLTVDDFLVDDAGPLVTDSGLPSRDLSRLGAAVTADVWMEAWRELAERRRVRSVEAAATATPARRRAGGARLPTPREEADRDDFAARLRDQRLVAVREFRLDLSVCVDVVRDVLTHVAGLHAMVDAGQVPARHLRNYATSPCRRPFGCQVQGPCLAALGTGDVGAVLRAHAADGRLRLPVIPATLGETSGPREAATP